MFVPFSNISPSSRLWIYQADRKFNEREKSFISNYLTSFTQRWSAHNEALKTSFDIRYDQFIILAADESHNAASGCSIDESIRAIKNLEKELGVDLFNRNLVAFITGREAITLIPLNDLKQKYNEGTWNEDTLTFNNLISVKSQLETDWLVSAGNTWLKRYVPMKLA